MLNPIFLGIMMTFRGGINLVSENFYIFGQLGQRHVQFDSGSREKARTSSGVDRGKNIGNDRRMSYPTVEPTLETTHTHARYV